MNVLLLQKWASWLDVRKYPWHSCDEPKLLNYEFGQDIMREEGIMGSIDMIPQLAII